MSSGIYQHRKRKAGEIVDAPMYNTAHKNQVSNDVPTSAGRVGEATALDDFRATLDPFPASVADPQLDLASEMEQQRFVIADIKTALNSGVAPTWWYSPVTLTQAVVPAFGAQVQRISTGQTIPGDGIPVAYSFDTTLYDTGVGSIKFFSASHLTRLTAPVAGLYYLVGHGSFATAGVTCWGILIRLNGNSTLAASQRMQDATVASADAQVSTLIHLAAGDYVELEVDQFTSGDESSTSLGFAIELLAPDAAVVTEPLTITVTGSGEGSVVSTPAGISTSTSESTAFLKNSTVTLTATATSGWFDHWEGDIGAAVATADPINVTMNQARSITAIFQTAGMWVNALGSSGTDGVVGFSRPTTVGSARTSTLTAAQAEVLQDCTLTNLAVQHTSALTAGQSITYALNVNGVASSAITVTLNSGDRHAFGTGTLVLVAGDKLCIEATAITGVPSIPRSFAITYKPTTARFLMHLKTLGDSAFGTTYQSCFGVRFDNVGPLNVSSAYFRDVELRGATVLADTAPGGGKSIAFRYRYFFPTTNVQTDCSDTITLADSATVVSTSDIHGLLPAAGAFPDDEAWLQEDNTASPAFGVLSLCQEFRDSGEHDLQLFEVNTGANIDTVTEMFMGIFRNEQNATEAAVEAVMSSAGTFVILDSHIGAAGVWALNLRVNGVNIYTLSINGGLPAPFSIPVVAGDRVTMSRVKTSGVGTSFIGKVFLGLRVAKP